MKKHKWNILFLTSILAFTVYISMDTFVISRAYQVNTTSVNTSAFANTTTKAATSATKTTKSSSAKNSTSSANKSKSETTVASNQTKTSTDGGKEIKSYSQDGKNISLKEYTYENTKVYVADITLDSAQSLKTAFASDTYGKNVTETTSQIASEKNAILSINGDYYGAREDGYVIRNGVVYRDEAGSEDVLCIYADGSMKVVDPSTVTAQELVNQGVWQAFSFSPGLVSEGKVSVSTDAEVGRAMASNPRTAIGLIDNNHYLFVVSDGRTQESEGLSLYQLAQFMKSLGAKTAYNLDGGGSSTMVFQGSLINKPTTSGRDIRERKVSDIVYIG